MAVACREIRRTEMNNSQTTDRVAFSEESTSSSVRLIAMGEIDRSLLDGLASFISRQRRRLGDEIDGDWAE